MENIDSKIIRSEAGTAGLVLGTVSGAYCFISYGCLGFLSEHMLVNWLLWGAKTFACIYLLAYFIKTIGTHYKGVDVPQARSFGTLVALFSAIITAFCQYAALEWCFPDVFKTTIDAALSSMGGMMDSNSLASIDEALPKLPAFSMGLTLVWCFLFGWIVSSIAAANIYGKKNPFDDKDDDII